MGFGLRAVSFGIESADFGSAGGFGFAPGARFAGGREDQPAKPADQFPAVLLLRAMNGTGQVKPVLLGQPAAGQRPQAGQCGGGKPLDLINRQPDFGLGVEFVDVLSAGAATAGELPLQSRAGDAQAGGEVDEGLGKWIGRGHERITAAAGTVRIGAVSCRFWPRFR